MFTRVLSSAKQSLLRQSLPTHSEEALYWLFLGRLSLLGLVLAVVVLGRVFGKSSSSVVAGYSLLAIGFAFNLISALLIEDLSKSELTKMAQIVFDTLLISVWIAFSKSYESYFAVLYLIQVLVASLTLYQKGGLFSALLSAIAFGISGHLLKEIPLWPAWYVYAALFVSVGFVGGYLSEELARTNQKLKLESIKMEELTALHSQIISGLPTGLLTVDSELRVNFANPAALHILNIQPEALIGKKLMDVKEELLPFFSQIPIEHLDSTLSATGSRLHRSYFVQPDEKGKTRLQQVVEWGEGTKKRILRGDVAELERGAEISGLLKEEAGSGRVLLFQDVTPLVRLEEKVKQNEKLAAVGQLAAGIAHEIRNPLASMSASIEMLKASLPRALTGDENHRLMEIAIREIDRLNRLVSEFLDYVKPEKMKHSPVDIKALFEELLLAVQKMKEFKTGISVEAAFDREVIVSGNAEKLKQVFWNLLVNAVQAIKPPGKIEVGSALILGEARARIWVSDSGCGMSEEVLSHLYEPFFTTKEKGTGLGLATAYKIIEAHNGEIKVDSKKGQGTRFEIILPKG